MGRLTLIHSIRESISPLPWLIWDVVPIANSGELLGFAAIRKREPNAESLQNVRTLLNTPQTDSATFSTGLLKALNDAATRGATVMRELPSEFFNHELKRLDFSNPDTAAAFFSTYGLLGFNNASMELLQASSNPDSFDIDSTEFDFGNLSSIAQGSNWLIDQYPLHSLNTAYRGWLKKLASSLKPITDSGWQVVEFAAYNEAELEAEGLLQYAEIAKACAVSDDADSLAKRLGCSVSDLESLIESNLLGINESFFSGVSVRAGYTRNGENPIFPGVKRANGTLGQAVALQIKQFAIDIDEDGYFVCSDCGTVFHRKRSDSKGSRKPKRSAKDVFCCDACKNRHNQMKHREKVAAMRKRNEERAAELLK